MHAERRREHKETNAAWFVEDVRRLQTLNGILAKVWLTLLQASFPAEHTL